MIGVLVVRIERMSPPTVFGGRDVSAIAVSTVDSNTVRVHLVRFSAKFPEPAGECASSDATADVGIISENRPVDSVKFGFKPHSTQPVVRTARTQSGKKQRESSDGDTFFCHCKIRKFTLSLYPHPKSSGQMCLLRRSTSP